MESTFQAWDSSSIPKFKGFKQCMHELDDIHKIKDSECSYLNRCPTMLLTVWLSLAFIIVLLQTNTRVVTLLLHIWKIYCSRRVKMNSRTCIGKTTSAKSTYPKYFNFKIKKLLLRINCPVLFASWVSFLESFSWNKWFWEQLVISRSYLHLVLICKLQHCNQIAFSLARPHLEVAWHVFWSDLS